MDEIPAISKGQKNAQQGFMYRGIDVVMNVLQPLLTKHKVFAVPDVLEQAREERVTKNGGNLLYSILKIKYTFFADDGSSVSAVVIGEAMDSADKASNKAMSVAFKYACFQVFCIPTEEMKDPDGETPPESKPITPPIIPPKKERATPTGTGAPTKIEMQTLLSLCTTAKIDVARVLATYNVSTLNEMSREQYDSAIRKLEASINKKG